MKTAAMLLITAALSSAATIILNSGTGTGGSNNLTGANVAITPHPAWAVPPLGSAWISYADTGEPGAFTPPDSTVAALAVFTETFSLPFPFNFGIVRIWADDTAALYLDGTPVGPAPNFALDASCASGLLGCEPNEYVDVSLDGLGAGDHALEIKVFQVGGSRFGLLYSGAAQSVESLGEVPEPVTLVLLGSGLLAYGLLRRRLRTALPEQAGVDTPRPAAHAAQASRMIVIVNLIAATTPKTGLRVRAEINPGKYPKGIKVSDKQVATIRLERDQFHGEWNYTILPRPV